METNKRSCDLSKLLHADRDGHVWSQVANKAQQPEEAHPKSASAISPGPLTMQPMMAMETPGRCPVRTRICSVTSCRSNSVRPQLGHDTYSVLVLRMREPCARAALACLRLSRTSACHLKRSGAMSVTLHVRHPLQTFL